MWYNVWLPAAPGKSEEDELYETFISETNKVYKVIGDELIEMTEYCGEILKYDMLHNKEVIWCSWSWKCFLGTFFLGRVCKLLIHFVGSSWSCGIICYATFSFIDAHGATVVMAQVDLSCFVML